MPTGGTRLLALLGAIAALSLALPAQASAGSAHIAALQVAMSALGLYPHPVDGITGPWTQQAVRTFQSQHGLAVDGVAGPQTRAALGKRGKPSLGARPMHAGQRGWDVAALQFLLHERGFEPGGFDGGFGPNTPERGSALPVGCARRRGRGGRPGDPERAPGQPGRLDLPDRTRSLLPPRAGADRRRLRLIPPGPLAHRRRLPGAEGDADPRRRGGRGLLRRPQHRRLRQPRRDHPPTRLRELVRAHVAHRRVRGSARQRRSDDRLRRLHRSLDRPAPALRGSPLRYSGRSGAVSARLPSRERASRRPGGRSGGVPSAGRVAAGRTATRAAVGPTR